MKSFTESPYILTIHMHYVVTLIVTSHLGADKITTLTPPPSQEEDYQWTNFTTSLNLDYIPTNTSISKQGGYNYTSTSLIDGFYVHSSDNSTFTSTTTTYINLNLDHYPVVLHIPHNTLIARPPLPTNIPPTRILNPIPPENIKNLT